MIRNISKKIIEIILKPIRNNAITFVMAFVLAAGFLLCAQLIHPLGYFGGVTIALWGIATAYFLSAAILLTPKYLRKIVSAIIFAILIIFSIVDVAIFAAIRAYWNNNFPSILAATNKQETTEFLSFYFSGSTLFVILAWAAICLFVFFACKYIVKHKQSLPPRLKKAVLYTTLAASMTATIFCFSTGYTTGCELSLLGKIYSFRYYNSIEELDAPTLQVTKIADTETPTIFLIIGESHSRLHTQLYGYEKENMPHLSALSPSQLVTFDSIDAPATHTQEAFKWFMTTAAQSNKQWYKSNNIIQLTQQAGIKTTWISNQNKMGIYANVISRFTSLCDTTLWTNAEYSITNLPHYDSRLTQLYDSITDHSGLTVFHLMGSHPNFTNRYPADFKGFKESEYTKYPEHQRNDLATYDTSILYTDSLLNEIFNRAEDIGAIAIYFSDHGLDVYNSDPYKCAHADHTDPASLFFGKQIPFFVYIPKSFAIAHPDLTRRIQNTAHNKGNTNQLFFTLMDILGLKSPQYPEAAKYSLFYDAQTSAN